NSRSGSQTTARHRGHRNTLPSPSALISASCHKPPPDIEGIETAVECRVAIRTGHKPPPDIEGIETRKYRSRPALRLGHKPPPDIEGIETPWRRCQRQPA